MKTRHLFSPLVAAAAALTLLVGCSSGTETPSTPDDTSSSVAPSAPGEGGIAITEVEANNTAESCWTVIDGNVYDLTEWIGQHPGGPERIESLCGTDGTEQFQAQHEGQSGPESRLESFLVGQLAG